MSRMPKPNRTIALHLTTLEDRTNPSTWFVDSTFASEDQILVTLDSNVSSAQTLEQIRANPWSADVEHLGFDIYQVSLQNGISIHQAISVYSQIAGVSFAEPDFVLGAMATPNDPLFNQVWGLHNTGQTGGTLDADIDAVEAWDIGRGTGQTIVAVIDTGVDFHHPDLAANMWINTGEILGNGIDDDGNGYIDDRHGYDFVNNDNNPMDDHGHGTHVAGTIGAVGNNGIGISGVAWNTRIMALKFLDSNGNGSSSNAIRAIDYAVQNGARILNNSWGGGGYSATLFSAIVRSQQAGTIFVAAAGNDSLNNDIFPHYPSNYVVDNVVSVASHDHNNQLSSFSNFGINTVDLAAPGSNILSTMPGGGYAFMSGTSMATPFVSGALAVFWDANPTLTYQEVIQRLLDNVDPVTALATRVNTGGKLNLNNLMNSIVPPVPPPPASDTRGARVVSATFEGPGQSLTHVRVTFNESIDPASFTLDDIHQLTGPNGPLTINAITAVSGSNNTSFDIQFASQTAFGNYTLIIGPDILDLAGNAMDQDQNLVNGQGAMDRFQVDQILAPSSMEFSARVPLVIRDFRTTTLTVNVPFTSPIADAPITDLDITLDILHRNVGDLTIRVTSPTGITVFLFSRRGGSGDHLENTVFDDDASTHISAGAAPFAGSFRPEQPLSVFHGQTPKGTWIIKISDSGMGNTGAVIGATISFSTSPAITSSKALGFVEDPIFVEPVLDYPEVETDMTETTPGIVPPMTHPTHSTPDTTAMPSTSQLPEQAIDYEVTSNTSTGTNVAWNWPIFQKTEFVFEIQANDTKVTPSQTMLVSAADWFTSSTPSEMKAPEVPEDFSLWGVQLQSHPMAEWDQPEWMSMK